MLTARKEASRQRNSQCKGPKVSSYKKALWLELSEPGAEGEEEMRSESQRGARECRTYRPR